MARPSQAETSLNFGTVCACSTLPEGQNQRGASCELRQLTVFGCGPATCQSRSSLFLSWTETKSTAHFQVFNSISSISLRNNSNRPSAPPPTHTPKTKKPQANKKKKKKRKEKVLSDGSSFCLSDAHLSKTPHVGNQAPHESDSDSLFTKFYNKESVSKAGSIQT